MPFDGRTFDFKNPDYDAVFEHRMTMLRRIRAEPESLPHIKGYYKDHPADFINDWGVGYDPRLIERGLPALIPLILFPRQREWIDWVVARWKASEGGMTPKSRDVGISSLATGLACHLCIFYPNMSVGFGSRKEEYVDMPGSPKSLLFKARTFMQFLPVEFRGNWLAARDAPKMRIRFPDTGSIISGEAGDGIGRGDRTALYFTDEDAHLERPNLIEASLSATTNCRIGMSSVNGMANPFAQKCHSWPEHRIFYFNWRDDPRKDDAWYAKQCEDFDPITVAQEIDINWLASLEGALIPTAWIQAAVDADAKLGIEISGEKFGALDVGDQRDKNAFAGRHGIKLEYLEEWSGKNSDIYASIVKAFGICDDQGYDRFRYDADGIGAGVKGDSRKIGEERKKEGVGPIAVESFRGSAGVLNPGKQDIKGRSNDDTFANYKAQAWWQLRTRFQKTFRAVVEGIMPDDTDELISIPGDLKLLVKLIMELSQITYAKTDAGKFKINKKPDNMPSPNLADAVYMLFARGHRRMVISEEVLTGEETQSRLARRLGGRRG